MVEKAVANITSMIAGVRENQMQVVFERSFRGDMRIRLRITVTDHRNMYLYEYPKAYNRFKARFESYLKAYFVETVKAADEIAARTYRNIEQAETDTEPFQFADLG